MAKKVRKVVIPAAGSCTELFVPEVYVLASQWRLCGAGPALIVVNSGDLIHG